MDKNNIGRRIRRAREARGLTQTQLAENLHLSANYIGLIERGVNTPALAVMISIAEELGVSLDYLAGTHSESTDTDCGIYRSALISKIGMLNKMQLLYMLDIMELMNKYNWSDDKIIES